MSVQLKNLTIIDIFPYIVYDIWVGKPVIIIDSCV